MSWFDELDERVRQQWRSRTARKRLGLSSPVEESLEERAIPAETPQPVQSGQHSPSRTTKIRLQVVPTLVPTTEVPAQSSEEIPIAIDELATSPSLPAVKAVREEVEEAGDTRKGSLSGRGRFESGQGEASIMNASVTETSVVVVMLAGDPGPVVVQYVSLQPAIGFTVHLSAPAKNVTPFNYIIL